MTKSSDLAPTRPGRRPPPGRSPCAATASTRRTTSSELTTGPAGPPSTSPPITCPVTGLHGAAVVIADPVHARHTAAIVPQAQLRALDDLGHFSIQDQLVPTVVEKAGHPFAA